MCAVLRIRWVEGSLSTGWRDGKPGEYVAQKKHSGWNGILHGGVTFSLMDEAFGWCLFFQNIPATTAKIETRFHKPIRIGASLEIKAWVIRQRRKLFDARAEVRVRWRTGGRV